MMCRPGLFLLRTRRFAGILKRSKDLRLALRLLRNGEHGKFVSYTLSHLAGIEQLLDVEPGTFGGYLAELISDASFITNLNETLAQGRARILESGQQGTVGEFQLGPLLYAVVRWRRPATVIETGVAAGVSSAYILRAIEAVPVGMLFSIDLPNGAALDPSYVELQRVKFGAFTPALIPKGLGIGYAVPAELRRRWRLILGDSERELPALLRGVGEIDMFFHDSKHSYAHMTFEYELAYHHLRKGGVLMSDDVGWNHAFVDFSRRVGRPCYSDGVGILVKE